MPWSRAPVTAMAGASSNAERQGLGALLFEGQHAVADLRVHLAQLADEPDEVPAGGVVFLREQGERDGSGRTLPAPCGCPGGPARSGASSQCALRVSMRHGA